MTFGVPYMTSKSACGSAKTNSRYLTLKNYLNNYGQSKF